MNQITRLTKKFVNKTIKHSPELLTALGIMGMWTAAGMAIKATPKAMEILELHAGYDHAGFMGGPTKPVEIIKLTWKCYLPAIGMGLVSTGCMVGATKINLERNAALAALYTLTENRMREYQDHVVRRIGKTKEKELRDEIQAERVRKNPPTDTNTTILGTGTYLCYESYSGRYFDSEIETIRRIQNDLNFRLNREGYISLDELFYEFGLKPNGMGNQVGWNTDTQIDFDFSSTMSDEEHGNRPCLCIDYLVGPRPGFSDLH